MTDYKKITENCIAWIKEWFEKNGKGCSAIIGMSGGKDSTIVAALCKEALGAENVIGVAMPDMGQGVNEADEICKFLGINYMRFPIGSVTFSFDKMLEKRLGGEYGWTITKWSEQAQQNIPPRVRMTTLYAIAQTFNGRVACCDNASENFIGYSTLFGDNVGSFAPIVNLTVTEVREIGKCLNIPDKWVFKTPSDGLPFSSDDEVKFGFTYDELDRYIKGNTDLNPETIDKIQKMHNNSEFKRKMVHIPAFKPE